VLEIDDTRRAILVNMGKFAAPLEVDKDTRQSHELRKRRRTRNQLVAVRVYKEN